MSRRKDRAVLRPGQLCTRPERDRLKLAAQDIKRQLANTTNPDRAAELERALAGIRREQTYDREVLAARPKRGGDR